nr:MAG TPA: hypothetical protein [Caudoviricetes sp.]
MERIISHEVLAFHLKNCKGTYNHIQRRDEYERPTRRIFHQT